MSITSGVRLTSISEKLRLNFRNSPLCMSKGKAILASDSDCESSGSNSGVCNASGLISLKRGSNELVERHADDIFFHLVKPKRRRSMQRNCGCTFPSLGHAVMWSLRQHRIQPDRMSLPSAYTSYCFWVSVADLANAHFGLKLSVQSALGLAKEMKEGGCECGEATLLFTNNIDYGPVVVPEFNELTGIQSEFISDDVLQYLQDFPDPSNSLTTFENALDPTASAIVQAGTSHALGASFPPAIPDSSYSHATFDNARGVLDPTANAIVQVGTPHALGASPASEPGPPRKKKKALEYIRSRLMKCDHLPRRTIYAAMQKFEDKKSAHKVWMNDSLEHKLDFLEAVTPRDSIRNFIIWRSTCPEISLLL